MIIRGRKEKKGMKFKVEKADGSIVQLISRNE